MAVKKAGKRIFESLSSDSSDTDDSDILWIDPPSNLSSTTSRSTVVTLEKSTPVPATPSQSDESTAGPSKPLVLNESAAAQVGTPPALRKSTPSSSAAVLQIIGQPAAQIPPHSRPVSNGLRSSVRVIPRPVHTAELQLTDALQKELVEIKERELKQLEVSHDAMLHELTFLNAYINLLEFDPVAAKLDPLEGYIDLMSEHSLQPGTQTMAGPSRRNHLINHAARPADTPSLSAISVDFKKRSNRKGKERELIEVEPEEEFRMNPLMMKLAAEASRRATQKQSYSPAVSKPEVAAEPTQNSSHIISLSSSAASSPRGSTDSITLRSYKRPRLDDGLQYQYTHEMQIPLPRKVRGKRSLQNVLSSYRQIEKDEILSASQFNDLVCRQAALSEKVDRFRNSASFNQVHYDSIQLEDEDVEADADSDSSNELRDSSISARHGQQLPESHWGYVVSHAIVHSKEIVESPRSQIIKKITRMVEKHWNSEEEKEDRERQAEMRASKARAKEIAKVVRAGWKLAVNVARARREAEEKLNWEREGQKHLDAMLKQSSSLSQARQRDLVEDGLNRLEETESSSDDSDIDTEDDDSTTRSSSSSDAEQDSDENSSYQGAHSDEGINIDGNECGDENESVNSDRLVVQVRKSPDIQPKHITPQDIAVIGSSGHLNSSYLESNILSANSTTPRPSFQAAPVLNPPSTNADTASPQPSLVHMNQEDDYGDIAMRDPEVQEALDDDEDFVAGEEEVDELGEDAYAADGGDSENEGLAADQEVPIEELLAQYGYRVPGNQSISQSPTSGNETNIPALVPKTNASPKEANEADGDLAGGNILSECSFMCGPDSSAEEELGSIDVDTAVVKDNAHMLGTEDDAEESTPKVAKPFLLRGNLRPYQQVGLEWLASLFNNSLNGILADEMGLGKTIQTIALLAYLACEKGLWGPHLIVVPTSVILNWEMEFNKFLPSFKILTYYGSQKERKEKRTGWTTENAFNVCITSYQLVIADQHVFRRKAWNYLVLDEAHNVKNFRSQRWQTLLGFKSQRRLLLTGTPLQNNLMELWSLLYFLMPSGLQETGGFANHKEFSEWFSSEQCLELDSDLHWELFGSCILIAASLLPDPMDKAIETGGEMDTSTKATLSRLHTLLRPYLLRRLKSNVEKQLPGKHEHVIYCRLSIRQRYLYDEFMSRSQTRQILESGNFLSIANCLMQLRKVCNHPDLFEVRPIVTSFKMERSVAANFEVHDLLVRRRLLQVMDDKNVDLPTLGLVFTKTSPQSTAAVHTRRVLEASFLLPFALEEEPSHMIADTTSVGGWSRYMKRQSQISNIRRAKHIAFLSSKRCQETAMYTSDLLALAATFGNRDHLLPWQEAQKNPRKFFNRNDLVSSMVKSAAQRAEELSSHISKFSVVPPRVVATDMVRFALPTNLSTDHPDVQAESFDTLHHSAVAHQIAFPDAGLLQYDCGKLQKLYELLRTCQAEGHRVLIFTQMTKVLDILEIFLNYHGHLYLRLDGSTKIEQRQIITERFNTDPRILCFIASSRSGGVGINLTGANYVCFYDNDWNPALDKQCQDRAHRIGQTREVHIYRFVSEHTIEENMLKRANQKRLLDHAVLQEGDFTTEYYAQNKLDWREVLGDDLMGTFNGVSEETSVPPRLIGLKIQTKLLRCEMERQMAQVEDEDDAVAGRNALAELSKSTNISEFDEASSTHIDSGKGDHKGRPGDDEGDEEDQMGGIDQYMLDFVQANWELFE